MAAADSAIAYLAALGENDPDAIAALVSDDFRNEHLSALGSGSTGRAEYRSRLPGFLAHFPERRYLVDEVVDDGSGEVVVRYRLEALHEGIAVDVPGIMWFTVRDGVIVRRTDCWDSLTYLRQVEPDSATE